MGLKPVVHLKMLVKFTFSSAKPSKNWLGGGGALSLSAWMLVFAMPKSFIVEI